MSNSKGFYNLDPNLILDVAENHGFHVTGELTQLNSYENRVFDVKLTSGESLISKFYRPGRWSAETILDEHNFIHELKTEQIGVASAIEINSAESVFKLKNFSGENKTLGEVDGIYYAFFEKVRGRLLQEITEPQFKKLGRWLARLHNVGSKQKAVHRASIGPTNDDRWIYLDKLLRQVSPEVSARYESSAVKIFEALDDMLNDFSFIRLHGDLHRGNILEDSQQEFIVVDFDDMINGPEVQDFWMLMPNADTDSPEFNTLIDAYSELREFPYEQLELIPLLRGYRIINYAIWIMNRWDDPSFPRIFPDFGSYSYWAEETENIEKIAFRF
jgi:Ser/Thr protein kinase RdoA (MazF antagonist)